jgi:hypothetical protein
VALETGTVGRVVIRDKAGAIVGASAFRRYIGQ